MTVRTLLLVASVAAACLVSAFALQRAGQRLRRRIGTATAARVRSGRAVLFTSLLLQAAVWAGGIVYLSEHWMTAHELRTAVAGVLQMSLTAPLFTLDDRSYTAMDVLLLPALLALVWIVASAVTRFLRGRILAATGMDSAFQDVAGMLLRYVLTFVGWLVVLGEQGVDLRSFAILASVLGVGIGFGLQNIANNFVSGLLINLERPIRVGDYVAVGGLEGSVVRIGARSTQIRTTDNVAIIVPNSRFLESEVVNWSHGDPSSRIHVPVTVVTGTDLSRARRVLLEAARSHSAVLPEPRAQVHVRTFGNDGPELELLVWTRDPRQQQQVRSDLNYRIAESMMRYGIEIASTQRDLTVAAATMERVLRTWRGEDAPAPAAEQAQLPEPPSELQPHEWDETDLAALADRMRGNGGVDVRDRRHLLSVYPDTFVGAEAVSWLVENAGLTRGEAVEVGRRMAGLGLFGHVLGEHDFRDGYFFYRFAA